MFVPDLGRGFGSCAGFFISLLSYLEVLVCFLLIFFLTCIPQKPQELHQQTDKSYNQAQVLSCSSVTKKNQPTNHNNNNKKMTTATAKKTPRNTEKKNQNHKKTKTKTSQPTKKHQTKKPKQKPETKQNNNLPPKNQKKTPKTHLGNLEKLVFQ